MSDEIYLDKIRLGAVIVQKELDLIFIFNSLLKDIRERPEIKAELQVYSKFHSCWQHIAELYDFLKNDYLDKLKKNDKEDIKRVMQNYLDGKKLELADLKQTKEIVLKIMSLSKFHDVVRKQELAGLGKVKERYKLK